MEDMLLRVQGEQAKNSEDTDRRGESYTETT